MKVGEIYTEITFEDDEYSCDYGTFKVTQQAAFRGHPKTTRMEMIDSRMLLTLIDSGYLVEMLRTHREDIEALVNKDTKAAV